MKIIFGGQTGADRAALDAAIDLGMEYGGSMPKELKRSTRSSSSDAAVDLCGREIEEVHNATA
jgi:hypothetical protein